MAISKRALFARFLDRSGIISLVQPMARKPLLLVINYHRLGNISDNRFDDGVFSANAASFEAQITYLRDHFRILRLNELLQLAEDRFRVTEPSVLITFDDGYRDNFQIGLPILARNGVSATFFVSTGYMDKPHLPWWDHISYVVKNTRQREILLDLKPPLRIDLRVHSRSSACKQVLHYYKHVKHTPEAFLKHLQDRTEVAVDAEALGAKLFMSWDDVKQLAASGMGVGSHTHSHQILSHLSEKDEQQELEVSKKKLETHLRAPVHTLSYPVGKRSISFTERTKRNAAAAGYRLAFSFDRGVNLPPITDPFDIQRVGVGVEDIFSLFRTRTMFNSFGKIF